MKKTILAAAALGTFGATAHAQSSITLYGLIDTVLVQIGSLDRLK